ncbi:MAG: NAD-dependent epimerase/dehydratase family protein [Actinomycetes bacterium]
MVSVAITGVGGLIGRRLVAALAEEPAIERVLGLDLHVPEGLTAPGLELEAADVRDPGIVERFTGVDVVVHLAFQLDPLRDEQAMWDVNVGGTRNVAEAAAAAGVRRLVYVSSAVVYGAHPDNDVPLDEDAPLRANPDFSYAEHKLEVERWLWPWAEQHPEIALTVLRPSIVAGPGVQNFISRQMEMPRMTMVKGHRPPMQFAHVDDVAAALAHATVNDLDGAYNVSSEGWLSFDEIVAISGRKVAEVGEEVAFALADRLWRAGLGEAPAGMVHYLMHPWVVSVDRLVATGWKPRHSNRDALAGLVAEHRDWLAFGGARVRRSTVRAATAGVVAVGGLAGITAALRRRTTDDAPTDGGSPTAGA